MTNQEYKEYYQSAFDSEYEKIIQDFIKVYKGFVKGHNENDPCIKEFIGDYRNDFIGKETNLTKRESKEDKYYIDLIDRFLHRKTKYFQDEFYLKFLDIDVSELKQRHKADIVTPEIYNATKKNTLNRIAIYYAYRKFLDRFFPNLWHYTGSLNLTTILEMLRGEKELNNGGYSDLNMLITEAAIEQPEIAFENLTLPKAETLKAIINAVGTIVSSETKIESLSLHTVKQSETGTEPNETIKPTFKAESVQEIFDILKLYFKAEQQSELKLILETGDNAKEHLLFQFSGGTLCDFFKQLHTGQFLAIAVKTELEKWIEKNFVYINKQGKVTIFKQKYVSRFISGTGRPAKGKRLIDIVDEDKKNKIKQLKITNREQNKRF